MSAGDFRIGDRVLIKSRSSKPHRWGEIVEQDLNVFNVRCDEGYVHHRYHDELRRDDTPARSWENRPAAAPSSFPTTWPSPASMRPVVSSPEAA